MGNAGQAYPVPVHDWLIRVRMTLAPVRRRAAGRPGPRADRCRADLEQGRTPAHRFGSSASTSPDGSHDLAPGGDRSDPGKTSSRTDTVCAPGHTTALDRGVNSKENSTRSAGRHPALALRHSRQKAEVGKSTAERWERKVRLRMHVTSANTGWKGLRCIGNNGAKRAGQPCQTETWFGVQPQGAGESWFLATGCERGSESETDRRADRRPARVRSRYG